MHKILLSMKLLYRLFCNHDFDKAIITWFEHSQVKKGQDKSIWNISLPISQKQYPKQPNRFTYHVTHINSRIGFRQNLTLSMSFAFREISLWIAVFKFLKTLSSYMTITNQSLTHHIPPTSQKTKSDLYSYATWLGDSKTNPCIVLNHLSCFAQNISTLVTFKLIDNIVIYRIQLL